MTFLLDAIFVAISDLLSAIVAIPITLITEILIAIFTAPI